MITVYAQGKIQQAREGQRAGDFGPAGSDFVVRPGNNGALKFVDENYRLQTGDALTVTVRGVAGK